MMTRKEVVSIQGTSYQLVKNGGNNAHLCPAGPFRSSTSYSAPPTPRSPSHFVS